MSAPTTASRWRTTPRTLARLLAGLWLFGTGEALLVRSELGNAPWTVLAHGIALQTPLTIGAVTVLVGAAVLACWIPLRERPGLGTLCNVIVIGLAIDVTLAVTAPAGPLTTRWLLVAAGIALIGVGSGVYLCAHLGPGPRDGLMTGIHRRTGWPVAGVRGGLEVTVLAAGWALGGTVGLGTIAFAALIGPTVGTALRALDR